MSGDASSASGSGEPKIISMSASFSGSSTLTATATILPRKISKIILNDFRAFPHSASPYEFDLGSDGKNLLLFGENGSGKSSVFNALKLLLSRTAPAKAFEEYRNIFKHEDQGTVTVAMTSNPALDFRWNYGDQHPSLTEGAPFHDLAFRCRHRSPQRFDAG